MCRPGFPTGLIPSANYSFSYGEYCSDSTQLSSFFRNYLHCPVTLPEAMAPSQGSPYSMPGLTVKSHDSFRAPLGVLGNFSLDSTVLPSLSFRRCWSQEHSLINLSVLSRRPNMQQPLNRKEDHVNLTRAITTVNFQTILHITTILIFMCHRTDLLKKENLFPLLNE